MSIVSVRIIMNIVGLNGLQVLCSGVKNTFLTEPCKEKLWLTAIIEFVSQKGKNLLWNEHSMGLNQRVHHFEPIWQIFRPAWYLNPPLPIQTFGWDHQRKCTGRNIMKTKFCMSTIYWLYRRRPCLSWKRYKKWWSVEFYVNIYCIIF